MTAHAYALFDRWLDADEASRSALLADLQRHDPPAHARLLALIDADARAGAAGFLATGSAGAAVDGAEAAAACAPAVQPGACLGPWRLVEAIGAGGMGEVWRAERADGHYEGLAAVKLLQPGRRAAHDDARFAREGELLARLAHPHIARLLDAGRSADGRRYLVLEHVQGERIDRWCDERRLGLAARLALFIHVCDAVAHAHAQLVLHRDLKPANVMVDLAGAPKLLDFGVAKLLDDDPTVGSAQSDLTREAAAGLTPDHAAPEQLDAGPVGTATDVYALGVMLFGLLSGARPYAAAPGSVARLVRAIVEEPPLGLRAAAAALPPAELAEAARCRACTPAALLRGLQGDLESIVEQALRKRPSERYPTVAALREDLQRHLDHLPVHARASGPVERVRKFVRRHPLPVAAGSVALAALVLGAGVALWQWRAAVDEARRTRAVVEVLTGLFTQVQPEAAGSARVSVLELLQRGWTEVERGLAGEPGLRAEVAWSLGSMLNAAGDVPAAQAAFSLRRQQLLDSGRGDSVDHLKVLLELGFCAAQLGDHGAARRHYDALLGVARRIGAEAGEEATLARLRLATLARAEGRLAEAEAGLRGVESEARGRWGPRHAVSLLALEELAELLRQRGRWDEAMAQYASLRQLTLGAQGAPAARAQLAEAMLLVELGRFADASAALEAAVVRAAEVWGEGEVTHTAVARLWLAQALFRSGRHAEAEAVADQALAALHPAGSAPVRWTVQVLQARHGLRGTSVPVAVGALARLDATVAEIDAAGEAMKPLAERARMLQAEALLRRGEAAAAQRLLARVLAAQRALYPEGDLDLWPSLALHGLAQAALGRPAEAQVDLDEAAALADRLLPPGHPDRHAGRVLALLAKPRGASQPDPLRDALGAWQASLAGHARHTEIAGFRDRALARHDAFVADWWRTGLAVMAW